MSKTNQLLAGASQIDITPSLGTIVGVDMTLQYARFIHDLLHAKAIVLQNNETKIAIIVVDICLMDTDFMNNIKSEITTKTGIILQNILLCCNHNHASGDIIGLLGGAADIAYRKRIPTLIIESVVRANQNLKPAKIAFGSVQAPEFVVCRRYLMEEGFEAKNPVTFGIDKVKTNPRGVEDKIIKRVADPDPEVYFLAIKDVENNWISVLGNYGLHYAADWQPDTITADYFGEFSNQIKTELNANDDFVAMMSNGTSGDVNIWDFMQPDRLPKEDFAKSKLIGQTLAKRVAEKINTVEWVESPALAVKYEEVEINYRKPNTEELIKAEQYLKENDFNDLGTKPDFIQRIYNREQLLLSQYPDSTKLAVQAFKIGDLTIGALPGEFFAETGLKLKADNDNYFSINLANSYGGYIPPKHEFENGGYETWRARSSCMEVDAEEKIRSKMSEMINGMMSYER
jgi:neutral ceramidase